MKTLFIAKRLDFITNGLAIPFTKIGEFGLCQDFNKATVDEFGPDLIISDRIHDKTYRHFDIKLAYGLDPFINLDDLQILPKEPKYCSDLVYLGSIAGFEKELTILSNYKYSVRHFDISPSDTQFYAGMIDMKKSPTLYHYAKACPVFDRSPYRELDIIAADGNPVFFDSAEQFLTDCINCFNGATMKKSKSREQILESHTNYDRVSAILSNVGLSVESKEVLNRKWN